MPIITCILVVIHRTRPSPVSCTYGMTSDGLRGGRQDSMAKAAHRRLIAGPASQTLVQQYAAVPDGDTVERSSAVK